MKHSFLRGILRGAAMLAVLAGLSMAAFAQQSAALAVPGGRVARDVPGAKELPDPNTTYKVVFDIANQAPKIDDVNPTLLMIAQYVNTLAKYGVPVEHRKIAVVIHHRNKGIDMILNNDAFKARNEGHSNPNIELIRQLKKAGVDLRVCGQAVVAYEIDPKTILPEIQVDLWALTSLVNLQAQGYVHIGGGN